MSFSSEICQIFFCKTLKTIRNRALSIKCRKTKTNFITTANQDKAKYHKKPMRTQSNVACKWPQVRELTRVIKSRLVYFNFPSANWLRKWREFSGPIKEHSKAKPMQSRIMFDTQLTITLFHVNLVLLNSFYL